MAVASAVFVSTWWLYTPSVRWLQVFASGMIAFTQAPFWMLDGAIGADVIDYDELNTGKRREGAFTACGSWITKVGLAIGAGMTGVVLTSTGFNSSLGAGQSEHALLMIRLFLAGFPLIGLGIAAVLLLRFPLTPEIMADIRLQLEARRGKV
jgi:GPH family glycoside/pentoside/hexuronide:cation symporter